MEQLKKIIAILVLGLIAAPIFAKNTSCLKFGISQSKYTSTALEKEWPLFINALEKASGHCVQLLTFNDQGALVNALKKGNVAMGYVKNKALIEHKKTLKPIAQVIEKNPKTGKPMTSYSSYVIAEKNSSVTSLRDLKNHKIAYTDPYSSSGYTRLKQELSKAGVRATWVQYDNITQALAAVKEQKAAAVGIWDYHFEKKLSNQQDYKIIAKFSSHPTPYLVVNTNQIAPALQMQITSKLAHFKGIYNIVGFKIISNAQP
ncbi:phosphate/phosphite/phosphonate ABC transporter substrate-binding protein [Legionella oakridgensis]|uniref:ABC-type phosphate/phosphonate transport system, periplasmic component n=2 Tax=Legionella oakridgensis TaxID=29423 RepID=W0BGM8_9GAMM|nr:PhnD/SsuA/transferrin family substrate-binding protein [Legionella oakridgensis]AHE67747.1 ABC-type phosphate/phosphonate transport system, periplasmic component [Legionella oakridgensis ATCC 33761 = DSM 21215]KTD36925.1 alkanesulfonate transporter substrate-binding subunit [Legionella oakridgensis]STY20766.1 alkanesulfonate transporter substrate-binding subunit [Legionella longbeachae]